MPSPALLSRECSKSISTPISLQIVAQRILLIEPDPLAELSIRHSLQSHPQLRIINYTINDSLSIETLPPLKPDLVILNADLPSLRDSALLCSLRITLPKTRILLLMAENLSYKAIAPFLGSADAYCVRNGNYGKLLITIACIQDGATYFDPEIAHILFRQLQPTPEPQLNSNLSERELAVLQLVVEGRSNPEIAATLYLSLSTVKAHLRNIMSKMAVADRVQVAVAALRSGLVKIPC